MQYLLQIFTVFFRSLSILAMLIETLLSLLEGRITGSKPTIVKELANVSIQEGDALSITANITGFPEPEVKWLKDNRPIPEDYRTKFEHGKDGEVKILIKNAKVKDSGQFSMTAKNSLGEVTSKADVLVTPPKR